MNAVFSLYHGSDVPSSCLFVDIVYFLLSVHAVRVAASALVGHCCSLLTMLLHQ
jgi:hypothetical protein